MNFLLEHYVWIKAFHYLGFVSFMAGLFYLPRLFVYHAENIQNEGFVSVVKIQERKLFWGINTTAMLATLLSGLLMIALNPLLMKMPHMHAKLSFALLLLVYYFDNFRYLKQFANDTCKKSGKFFRAYNEVPTLLFIGIVVSFAVVGVL
ncbi:protoporphyrinogen oxidase HemJ [Campylobacter sp. MIT 99-7217]|uniref:protoporphyrinogen oxidase HemJ n=1 Tax=Campylobacter sp. MIT 99-7217 TaxID=535091 RepID=UPI00115AC3D4|nr:protoporphyrinogen oxidase HemJ [Campylobacter sp. MIT 99-7217]TQR32474.1 protoporphyrinogen oxidase HemJ [Campylobacter sp. MIT 99-7217]